ncbi:mitochondrial fission process protein 1 [Willisornis vidua]|uniref:Mitochondrial fission process protein 1 n=1 Tax=Willisornis vidua TaxID=1566151 RepID=A0ABQ9CUR1_9PASS|nr:mitochondrial fission process protein 1 [Willisornis vidua]
MWQACAGSEILYTNENSMGNKHEELDATVQQETYNVITIMELSWHYSHDWSAVMYGYKFFRRYRQCGRGSWVALYISNCFDDVRISDHDDKVECLWVKIRGKVSRMDVLVGVCFRPPSQNEQAAGASYWRLA